MIGVLLALGVFGGLLWYIKAPRMVYWMVLGGASVVVLAARFLLPETHPVRVNAGDDLDGLVVVLFIAVLVLGYRWWFRSLKARKQALAGDQAEQSEQGFVIIDEDAALTRDVEGLLARDAFSVLKRDGAGQIAASCRIVIDAEIARLGPIYAPQGLEEMLGEIVQECDWRGAKMLVVELLREADTQPYLSAGFEEFGRLETGEIIRISMKKDLT